MINIKAIWLYAALAASLCGGFGAGYAVYPEVSDIPELMNKARMETLRECEAMRESANAWRSAPPRNTPGKEF